jgi:hypothetical protein
MALVDDGWLAGIHPSCKQSDHNMPVQNALNTYRIYKIWYIYVLYAEYVSIPNFLQKNRIFLQTLNPNKKPQKP